jgi:hypothetical protein
MDTERSVAARATPAKDGYSGVASTIGTVDRMKRCFLPGAFGDQEIQVPLLAYHDDGQPVGVSVLTPPSGRPYVGAQLTHHSRITPTSGAENFHALIRDGAIPATSIGWESHEDYLGWSALERGNPALARLAASIGVVQREDVHYFARIEILENSLVPVPANPLALLAVAGLSVNAEERAMTDALMELAGLKHVASVVPEKAAGARHSTTDQAMIQSAHDSLMNLGATCPLPAGAPEVEGASAVDPDGITGGWQQFMRGPYGSKLETRDVAGVSALVATELNKQAVSGDILTASYAVAQAMCAAFEAADAHQEHQRPPRLRLRLHRAGRDQGRRGQDRAARATPLPDPRRGPRPQRAGSPQPEPLR